MPSPPTWAQGLRPKGQGLSQARGLVPETALRPWALGLSPSKITVMASPTATRLALPRRQRRLRRTESIRSLVRETRLTPDCFIYPLFVVECQGIRKVVSLMPGVFQLSVDHAVAEARAARAEGISGVLLFGLPETKDAIGSQ